MTLSKKLNNEAEHIVFLYKQINLSIPNTFLKRAEGYAKKCGYSAVQELILDLSGYELYDTYLTDEEIEYIKQVKAVDERNYWVSEEEIFDIMKSKSRCII